MSNTDHHHPTDHKESGCRLFKPLQAALATVRESRPERPRKNPLGRHFSVRTLLTCMDTC